MRFGYTRMYISSYINFYI